MSSNIKKNQKMKYKKAPGAPKRFKSAYMYFSEQEHKRIRDNSNNKKVSKETARLGKWPANNVQIWGV